MSDKYPGVQILVSPWLFGECVETMRGFLIKKEKGMLVFKNGELLILTSHDRMVERMDANGYG